MRCNRFSGSSSINPYQLKQRKLLFKENCRYNVGQWMDYDNLGNYLVCLRKAELVSRCAFQLRPHTRKEVRLP